jgi:hypothetical protein
VIEVVMGDEHGIEVLGAHAAASKLGGNASAGIEEEL